MSWSGWRFGEFLLLGFYGGLSFRKWPNLVDMTFDRLLLVSDLVVKISNPGCDCTREPFVCIRVTRQKVYELSYVKCAERRIHSHFLFLADLGANVLWSNQVETRSEFASQEQLRWRLSGGGVRRFAKLAKELVQVEA